MQVKIESMILDFQQVYSGGNWLEEDFIKKLHTLSETEAFATPGPGVHSVAEVVWHCIYWRRVLIERLEGDQTYRDRTIAEQNFLSVEKLKETTWRTLLHELEKTQDTIISLLKRRDDHFLKQEYAEGKTFEHVIAGTFHHDLYHLGQIGLIIKINRLNERSDSTNVIRVTV